MQLFTRRMLLEGNQVDAMEWATKITAHVNGNSDHVVTAWAAGFGDPIGTVSWSSWMTSHNDLLTAFGGLADDKGYDKLIRAGESYTKSPPEDGMRELIHPAEPATAGSPPPIGAVGVITTAVAAGGKMAEVIAFGVEVSQHVTSVTGNPLAFFADMYGTFGQVSWIAVVPTMADADAANTAINGDAAYQKMVGKTGDLFVPGSGHRALYSRLA